MSDLPFPVQIVATHGHVPAEVLPHAEDVVRRVARKAPAPILFARVSISHDEDPAVRRRVVAKASLDVNGRAVRAHIAAEHFDEALDLLHARLRRGLEVLAEHRQARRKGTGVSGEGEWRHGDLPTHRPTHHPRPQASREIVCRKSYVLPLQSLEEAALDLELLDHDWVLFTWRETGQDVVLASTDDGYRLLVPANRHADGVAPVPRVQIDHGVPTLALRDALQTLDLSGAPFVFFVDVDTRRGTVAYLRYDGHYGVVVPPERTALAAPESELVRNPTDRGRGPDPRARQVPR